jgi:V8-like Glu-specific endopeptidase
MRNYGRRLTGVVSLLGLLTLLPTFSTAQRADTSAALAPRDQALALLKEQGINCEVDTRQIAAETPQAERAPLSPDLVSSLSSGYDLSASAFLPELLATQGSAPSGPTSSFVIGADSRVRISPADFFPWSAQCHLEMTFPDGTRVNGSGTLIGDKYVLTAGHCVFFPDFGGWATSIKVFPGRDGDSKPWSANSVRLRSVTGWTVNQDSDYDYGLITLDGSVGWETGWFAIWPASDSDLSATANLSGYPGDKPAGTQWYAAGSVTGYNSNHVDHNIDIIKGDSGAGVYRFYGSTRYVYGTQSTENWSLFSGYFNRTTRINNTRYNNLVNWMATGF